MTCLAGKIILVTGASAGIGLATAETLARQGAKVIACARNVQKIEDLNSTLAKGGYTPVHIVKADMTSESSVLALFQEISQKFGKLDVLINNAGTGSAKAGLTDGEFQEWKALLDLNVLGLTLATREAVKLIEAGGSQGGHIININSFSGHNVSAKPGPQFYAGTKHMVTALTEGLRKTVQSKNIRVTSLSPGFVETEIMVRIFGPDAANFFTELPYKVLEAKDIADAIVYVLSVPAHVNIDEMKLTPLARYPG